MADEIDTPLEGDTFDRAYVEKLRSEAARYRTSLRPFEDAFGDFDDNERSFLFGMLAELNKDPTAGAVQFRDMAKSILQDDFYKDLDDLPTQVKEETPTPTEKEDQVSLTPEQMQTILDERDAKRDATAAERAEQAKNDAAVEGVFKEIEAAGFERGSDEFMTALSLGQTLSQQGKEVDFAALAPKVRTFHDLPEPEATDEQVAPAEEAAPAAEHAKTATAGGSGRAAESAKDWIAEAKESGQSLMDAASDRAEARLDL